MKYFVYATATVQVAKEIEAASEEEAKKLMTEEFDLTKEVSKISDDDIDLEITDIEITQK